MIWMFLTQQASLYFFPVTVTVDYLTHRTVLRRFDLRFVGRARTHRAVRSQLDHAIQQPCGPVGLRYLPDSLFDFVRAIHFLVCSKSPPPQLPTSPAAILQCARDFSLHSRCTPLQFSKQHPWHQASNTSPALQRLHLCTASDVWKVAVLANSPPLTPFGKPTESVLFLDQERHLWSFPTRGTETAVTHSPSNCLSVGTSSQQIAAHPPPPC
mmetsp:Transcript_27040/g.51494  ORF Transcript_27040/g.51494 Transcript_27040/m.51494 type:complete len:212 (-) Transcript_27040:347-982(-)